MERRNSLLVILLAAILGSAAIAPRSSGRSYEAPTAAPTQSPTRSEKSGAESGLLTPRLRAYDARGIINEFFSGTANDSLDKSPSGELTPRRASPADYQGWTVESLIATLPDPVESGLGSMFDDFVDSIEHAVTADGYYLDQFYNPWPSPDQLASTQKDDQSDETADSSDESQVEKQLIPIYEKEPGLILFRNYPDRRSAALGIPGWRDSHNRHSQGSIRTVSGAGIRTYCASGKNVPKRSRLPIFD